MTKQGWRGFFCVKTNPIVKALTISDIFILSGFGLISPIFAVFLTENIQGGSVEVVGLASMIYLLTKSLGQIPIAQIVDKIRGEKDDFLTMFFGSVITSLVPLLYLIARIPLHIYCIQFIYGLSQALIFPSWMAIFTRHIDINQEGTQWGIYYTLIDLSSAGAAAIGGFVAYYLGFTPLLVTVSFLSFVGSSWLLLIKKQIEKNSIFKAQYCLPTPGTSVDPSSEKPKTNWPVILLGGLSCLIFLGLITYTTYSYGKGSQQIKSIASITPPKTSTPTQEPSQKRNDPIYLYLPSTTFLSEGHWGKLTFFCAYSFEKAKQLFFKEAQSEYASEPFYTKEEIENATWIFNGYYWQAAMSRPYRNKQVWHVLDCQFIKNAHQVSVTEAGIYKIGDVPSLAAGNFLDLIVTINTLKDTGIVEYGYYGVRTVDEIIKIDFSENEQAKEIKEILTFKSICDTPECKQKTGTASIIFRLNKKTNELFLESSGVQ